ncbi:MAG: hypothetical protein Q6K70_09575 [Thermostichales cyanobacterium DRC_bins_46]
MTFRFYLGALLASVIPLPGWAAEPTLELDAQLLEQSPVLQRWLTNPPDVLEEIRTLTTRPTRLQLGYVARDQWFLGFDDLYLGSQLSLSGEYDRWHLQEGRQEQVSVALRYFVLQPGSRFNLAPQAGYRSITTTGLQGMQGLELGATAVAVLAPQTADLSIDYRWLTGSQPATTLSITTAYALSRDFRLATRYRWQNTTLNKDFQVGIMLEWTP